MTSTNRIARLGAVMLAAIGTLWGTAANALVFNIVFDNVADAGVSAPLVGSGVFSFDGDPVDGSYALSTLSNVVFEVSFQDGDSFTLADTEDVLSEVLAVIVTNGSERTLRFGNVNGNSGGTINGSFDLINQDQGLLTFQPGVSGGDLYASTTFFGNYRATTVPVPPAVLLFGSALLTLVRRRKR